MQPSSESAAEQLGNEKELVKIQKEAGTQQLSNATQQLSHATEQLINGSAAKQ